MIKLNLRLPTIDNTKCIARVSRVFSNKADIDEN
jgi:uncharacterized protein YfcZ (UPF0381/DUF406 family)